MKNITSLTILLCLFLNTARAEQVKPATPDADCPTCGGRRAETQAVGGAVGVRAATVTVGSNINAGQIGGYQAETAIAINPTDPQKIVVFSNNRPINGIFRAYSSDGGRSWTRGIIATGADGMDLACCDATACFDKFGTLFFSYLTPASTNRGTVVYASTDSGATFTKVGATLGNGTDQPTIVSGPGNTVGSTTVWVQYTDNNNSLVVRGLTSTALGVFGAFGPAITIPNTAGLGFGDIAVGPLGQVMVIFQTRAGQGPDTIQCSVDADGLGPVGFTIPTLLTDTNVGGFDAITPQPFRTIDAEGGLAIDTTGGPFNGRAYAVYTEESPDESDDTDIFYRFSDDFGLSWSTPLKLNDDNTPNSQFFPRMALDPTNGAIAIAWMDCRNDTGTGPFDRDTEPNTDAMVFATVSVDGGATFTTNFRISEAPTNALLQNNLNEFADYIGIAFYQGVFFPAWPDNSNSTGDNPDQTSQFDIYVASVTLDPDSSRPPPPLRSELYVQSVTLAQPPSAGQSFRVIATIGNAGPGKSSNFFVSAFNDPKVVSFNDGTKTNFNDPTNFNNSNPMMGCTPGFAASKKVDVVEVIGGLGVGNFVNVVLEMLYCDGGDYTLTVLVDSQRNAPETNELNNGFEFRVTVPPLTTDLALANMITTNTTPGTNATFTADVRNLGQRASGPVLVGFYANRSTPPTSFDVPDQTFSIPNIPGVVPTTGTPVISQVTVTFTLPTQNAPRGGRAWIFADYANTVVETNETNNTLSSIWGITNAPPGIISGLTPSTLFASVGELVTFTVGASDPTGDTLTYVWHFGDGTPPFTAGASVTHAFIIPGVFKVSVSITDGPFNIVESSATIEILDSNLVDLGFVVAKSGYVKLAVPVPPGFIRKDRPKGKITQGSAGDNVRFNSLRLTGKPGAPGVYVFTVDYISVKAKKAGRVRYKYTVL